MKSKLAKRFFQAESIHKSQEGPLAQSYQLKKNLKMQRDTCWYESPHLLDERTRL